MTALLDSALRYAALGWRVLPLHTPYASGCSCAKQAGCRSIGKHPRTTRGSADSTTAVDQIRSWWHRFRDANVAIATGRASGLLVLDIDPRNGGPATLVALEQELGCLPQTASVLTGGGGWHLLFRAPVAHGVCGTLGDGIDVKFDGGYVVAAPSRHASGADYVWAQGRGPEAVTTLPQPWESRLARRAAALPVHVETRRPVVPRAMSEHRARKYARSIPPAVSGRGGDQATFLAAVKVGVGFGLDPETTFQILWTEWNPRCRPPWTARELRRKVNEARKAQAVRPGFLLDTPRRSR